MTIASEDPARIAELIEQVRALDLRTVEFDVLRSLLRDSFIGMRTRALWSHEGQVLYRGVRVGDKPRTRARLSYPPPELATTWGRVTQPGRRVFYASVARDSIPFEIGLSPGDHVALGRWRARDELMLMQIGFSDGSLQALGGSRSPPEWMHAPGDPIVAYDEEVNAFLSDYFCRRVEPGCEYLYKVSAAIADSLLHNTFTFGDVPGYAGAQRVAGLLYPAIAMSGTADNLALLPEAVDDSLQLDWVEWLRVEAISPHACQWRALDFANSFGPAGEIEWKGRPPQFVIPPQGRYVMRDTEVIEAFDAAGVPIDPS